MVNIAQGFDLHSPVCRGLTSRWHVDDLSNGPSVELLMKQTERKNREKLFDLIRGGELGAFLSIKELFSLETT